MEQARLGAQERSKVDWDSEIEKAKEDNDSRIAQMRSKADEAAKKMHIPTDDKLPADDDDDDFGPSLALASSSTADDNDDDDSSSDDDDKNQARVSSIEKWKISVAHEFDGFRPPSRKKNVPMMTNDPSFRSPTRSISNTEQNPWRV